MTKQSSCFHSSASSMQETSETNTSWASQVKRSRIRHPQRFHTKTAGQLCNGNLGPSNKRILPGYIYYINIGLYKKSISIIVVSILNIISLVFFLHFKNHQVSASNSKIFKVAASESKAGLVVKVKQTLMLTVLSYWHCRLQSKLGNVDLQMTLKTKGCICCTKFSP